MTNTKPWTIKVMLGFYIARLVFITLLILTFAVVKDFDSSTKSVGAAIQDGIVRKFHLDMSNSGFALGTLIGMNIIPVMVAILGIIFILKRKYTPSIVILVIDLLIGLGMHNPFMAIVNSILFFQKKSKEYMKGINKAVENDLSTFLK